MNHFTIQFKTTLSLLQANVHYVLLLIGLLYGIHLINWISGYRLNFLGIYPRKEWGLPGIFCAPFLHGSFNHLFFNSIPLFLLANFILLSGLPTFLYVSAIIIFLSGLATWLFGRSAFHIGASGVIMGYWSYLLFNAYQQSSILSITLAAVCIYYFGGMILNLFPLRAQSSWEGHVFGFLAGIAAAYFKNQINL